MDDFWGSEAWNQWEQEIGKALPPEEYPIEDISAADPIMREMFDLEKVPQITNVTFWLKNNGKTSERDEDSAQVHCPGDPRQAPPDHGPHDAQYRCRRLV